MTVYPDINPVVAYQVSIVTRKGTVQHRIFVAEIGGTKVLSNQMGYVFQNEHLMNGFDSGKYIEIY